MREGGGVEKKRGQSLRKKMDLIQKEIEVKGAQWLSGREVDLRLRGRRFEPHQPHVLEQEH